jgi:CBS domain-containing protein
VSKVSRAPGAREEEPPEFGQVNDAARRTIDELLDVLRTVDPGEPLTEAAFTRWVREQTEGRGPQVYADVLDALPVVEDGELRGVYAARAAKAVGE